MMKARAALLLILAAVLVLSATGCAVLKEIGWGFQDLAGPPASQFTVGSRHREVGRYEEAIKAYAQFVKANPKDQLVPWAKLWIGHCLAQRGDTQISRLKYTELIKEHAGTEAAKFAQEWLKPAAAAPMVAPKKAKPKKVKKAKPKKVRKARPKKVRKAKPKRVRKPAKPKTRGWFSKTFAKTPVEKAAAKKAKAEKDKQRADAKAKRDKQRADAKAKRDREKAGEKAKRDKARAEEKAEKDKAKAEKDKAKAEAKAKRDREKAAAKAKREKASRDRAAAKAARKAKKAKKK